MGFLQSENFGSLTGELIVLYKNSRQRNCLKWITRITLKAIRLLSKTFIIMMIIISIWSLVSLRVFIYPSHPEVKDVDTVFVPATIPGRFAAVEEIMSQGIADTLVVSVPEIPNIPPPEICESNREYEIICVTPRPSTTQGEAIAISQIAHSENWNKIAVLTFDAHSYRTKLLISRCWNKEIRMLSLDYDLSFYRKIQVSLYETGAVFKSVLTPDCESKLPDGVDSFLNELKR